MSEFLSVIPKLVGDDIMAPPKPGRTIPHTILDGHAKESLASALIKMKDAKEELEQIHKVIMLFLNYNYSANIIKIL